jgi:hypothetical protein
VATHPPVGTRAFPSSRAIAASVLATATFVLWSPVLYAGAGRTGAPILDLPHRSPRGEVLGAAVVTYDGSVDTLLWNPAGLSTLQRPQLYASRVAFGHVFGAAGEGLSYTSMGAAAPLFGLGVLGAFIQRQGNGTIDVTTDSPDVIATESLGTDWVFGVSYAKSWKQRFRGGVTAKAVHLQLGTGFEGASSANSYAVDFGGQLDLPVLPITLAGSVTDLGTDVQFRDAYQSDPLPRKLYAGASLAILDDPLARLTVSAGVVAAIDKLSQNRADEDFVETVDERVFVGANDVGSDYAGMTREEIADQLVKQRGAGVHAFDPEHLGRSLGVEATVFDLATMRCGYRKLGDEPGYLRHRDRITFGLSIDLDGIDVAMRFLGLDPGGIDVPVRFDYTNALWGAGGPLLTRAHSFSLTLKAPIFLAETFPYVFTTPQVPASNEHAE